MHISAALMRCCAADLHHDSFYDELPSTLRAEVTLEITATVFQGSTLLSGLVCLLCHLLTAQLIMRFAASVGTFSLPDAM